MPSSSERRRYDVACPIACALDTVGERWTLLILRELLPGPLRFSELKAAILGINATILSRRLEQMLAEGLVQVVELRASVTGYGATRKAESLWPLLLTLAAWGVDGAEVDRPGLTPAAAVTAFVALRPAEAPRLPMAFVFPDGTRLDWQPQRPIPIQRGASSVALRIDLSASTLLALVLGRLSPAQALADGRLVLTGAEPQAFLDHLGRPL